MGSDAGYDGDRMVHLASGLTTVGLLLAAGACLGCQDTRSFPPLDGITRVEVRTNVDSLGTIIDSQRIAAIVAFVNARRRDWEQPWAGVPIGTLGVTFFTTREVRGSFRAGPNFFEAQRDGDWFSRDATASEIAQWRLLLTPYGTVTSKQ
jgi:hypothetical protein